MSGLLGGLFGEEFEKLAIWEKGHPILGSDPAVWRHDDFWSVMCYWDHGNRSSEYGWEKDHIVPRVLGGSDDISNLRPLNYRNNAVLGGMLSGLGK